MSFYYYFQNGFRKKLKLGTLFFLLKYQVAQTRLELNFHLKKPYYSLDAKNHYSLMSVKIEDPQQTNSPVNAKLSSQDQLQYAHHLMLQNYFNCRGYNFSLYTGNGKHFQRGYCIFT